MPCIRDVLESRDLYFVRPGQSVAEAARYMSERNVGAACVLEGDRLVGILSERDLMNKVVASGRDPGATRVSEVMTAKPVVVGVQENCETCLKIMQRASIRHLPVVDGDKLVGLVSLRDLLQVDRDDKVDQLKLMEDYIHYVPPPKPRL